MYESLAAEALNPTEADQGSSDSGSSLSSRVAPAASALPAMFGLFQSSPGSYDTEQAEPFSAPASSAAG